MYEQCRRIGHAWEEQGDAPLGYEHVERDVCLRCTRCSMLRFFDIAANGSPQFVRYIPPEGYYWTDRTVEAPTKADYRLEWLRDIRARHNANGRRR